jgi:hypothetical protein
MKRFSAAIAISATLLFIQSCSSSVKSAEETPPASTPVASSKNLHEGHSMNGSEMVEMKMPKEPNSTQAKLTTPAKIAPKTPVSLMIDVRDRQGKAIAQFDTFQEKLMHLIVVSDDLQFFDHIHPSYRQNGRFDVGASFPQPGSYTLFSDYKPAQQSEVVSVLKLQVPGASSSAKAIALNRTKTLGDTKANLTFSKSTLKADEEVTVMFDLWQAANNQPIQDLQPYLGQRGHLVILRQVEPLAAKDYIHAHAVKNSEAGRVEFTTKFPKPGKYKLWGQFNRNGKIMVADFWVDVQ